MRSQDRHHSLSTHAKALYNASYSPLRMKGIVVSVNSQLVKFNKSRLKLRLVKKCVSYEVRTLPWGVVYCGRPKNLSFVGLS